MTIPASVKIDDLVYQEGPSGQLLARVYRPQGAGPFPCLIDVHGGGWGATDRLANAVIDEYLARAGIVVAAIDFRLSSEARFPASVADTNLGIRWLKSMAHEFGSRLDLVGGLGSSSGGHQLLLNVLRPADPLYASLGRDRFAGIDASLKFAVACWPVADPWARYQMARQSNKEGLLRSHAAYWASDEEMKLGNPQLILERGEQTHLPPVLLMQGTADDNLTPDMAEHFGAAYRGAGGHAELETFAGQPHAFVTRQPDSDAATTALAMMARFIKAHSGRMGPPGKTA
jgi:acetyl esterase